MAENRNDIPEQEAEIIVLEFDDGATVNCEIMGIFDVDGKDYIALIPDDGSDDVWIYAYQETENEDGEADFDIDEIQDEALFEKVAKEFDEIMKDLDE